MVDIVRLFLMRQMVGFPPVLFIKSVIIKCLFVMVPSIFIALLVKSFIDEGFVQLIIVSFTCIATSIFLIYIVGLDANERKLVNTQLCKIIKK